MFEKICMRITSVFLSLQQRHELTFDVHAASASSHQNPAMIDYRTFVRLYMDYVHLQVISNLDMGVDYYVRVSARNSLGYGSTQSSSPTYQHPYEEPTPPTDVVLGVTSDTMLTVSVAHTNRNCPNA